MGYKKRGQGIIREGMHQRAGALRHTNQASYFSILQWVHKDTGLLSVPGVQQEGLEDNQEAEHELGGGACYFHVSRRPVRLRMHACARHFPT
eukprot:scaffold36529_cov18-Tisochrysis_lutea.AAC.1